nr:immunoglobulin heavy chain junction region [Macaca mulatta]MOV35935.1 immunoglobulin heavy chain junction region [Macaca mulatta]MOV36029.1 immunoglobulin heavy chain junction region [Macaca mulatta]MOV36398.1 immunoglobulin heavy chain junction region [Macaca mulatta]MOV36431.1 immunoglobulin heavy chain junction region [Macaca mulatta]
CARYSGNYKRVFDSW